MACPKHFSGATAEFFLASSACLQLLLPTTTLAAVHSSSLVTWVKSDQYSSALVWCNNHWLFEASTFLITTAEFDDTVIIICPSFQEESPWELMSPTGEEDTHDRVLEGTEDKISGSTSSASRSNYTCYFFPRPIPQGWEWRWIEVVLNCVQVHSDGRSSSSVRNR